MTKARPIAAATDPRLNVAFIFDMIGHSMGQLRTGNKRRKRLLAAQVAARSVKTVASAPAPAKAAKPAKAAAKA